MTAEGSGAVPPAFETGSYVRIEGLQRGTEHNGRFGFVVGKPADDSERFSVVVAHHDVLLNVKPDNLVLERQDRTSRRHEVVMVYPNLAKSRVRKPDEMLVAAGQSSPLRGWPSDYTMEEDWLREVLGWRYPVCVTGVTRGTMSKADLVMYIDAASEHCLVNEHAQAAIAKLPTFELNKVYTKVPAKVRGAVILVYSPTMSITSTSRNFQEQPNAGKMTLDDAAVAVADQHRRRL